MTSINTNSAALMASASSRATEIADTLIRAAINRFARQ